MGTGDISCIVCQEENIINKGHREQELEQTLNFDAYEYEHSLGGGQNSFSRASSSNKKFGVEAALRDK